MRATTKWEQRKIESNNWEQRYDVLLTDCLTLNGLMKHRVLWVDTLPVRNLCADMNINTCHEYINRYREYIFLSNSDVIKTNFNFQITNAQSAGLHDLVAAESALQQPMQRMRNIIQVSKECRAGARQPARAHFWRFCLPGATQSCV